MTFRGRYMRPLVRSSYVVRTCTPSSMAKDAPPAQSNHCDMTIDIWQCRLLYLTAPRSRVAELLGSRVCNISLRFRSKPGCAVDLLSTPLRLSRRSSISLTKVMRACHFALMGYSATLADSLR